MNHELLGSAFSTAEMEREIDSRAWVQAMLDFEAALARAQARVGVIPAQAADAIAAACRVEHTDIAAIAADTIKGGNPAIPLVKALTARVAPQGAGYVHWGATSQDAMDTGLMLVFRRALPLLLADLQAIETDCAGLAETHRGTVLAGRTLLQQALPVTFGLKAAGWCSQIRRARLELERVGEEALAVQCGGAVGTLASLGDRGLDVSRELARELDLAEPDMPWHTARDRVVKAVSALVLAAGAAGKIATDVLMLMQTEVGEVREPAGPGRGGSSTMPHKRNPVGCTLTLAAVRRLHGMIPTIYASMLQEHERAAGAWQAEWETVSDSLRLTAAALHHVRAIVDGLEVDAARMRGNLDLTLGLIMAEAVMMELAPELGRGEAHARVKAACQRAVAENRTLQAVLGDESELVKQLGQSRFDELFMPERYLGVTDGFIDRVLARVRADGSAEHHGNRSEAP
ncbi:MAG: 3-carboxy-cis,cis-muconate cycloisomerase [Aquisalimonadaceae bacterium]